MRKNNIWNKIFHRKDLNKNVENLIVAKRVYNNSEDWLYQLGQANTLSELMILHKRMWREGYQNRNLCPNEFGMFRTKDISTMTIDQVYIGGYGLNTNTIEWWEQHIEEPYNDEVTCYDIIFSIYKNLLISNIKELSSIAHFNIEEFIKNGYNG
jgi:hypothetical protein